MQATFHRQDDGPNPPSLTIQVGCDPSTLEELVRFKLANRPFVRDLVKNRVVIFWQLTAETGATLVLRPGERFQDLEDLAHQELHFVANELTRQRRNERYIPLINGVL